MARPLSHYKMCLAAVLRCYPLFGQGGDRNGTARLGGLEPRIKDLHDNNVCLQRGEVPVRIDASVKYRSKVIQRIALIF